MSPRHPWARLREDRGATPGRHTPGYLESHPMPASPAASLPLQSGRPDTRPVPVAAGPGPAGPEPVVQCGWCHVMGPLSQIPGDHGFYRCARVWECAERYLDGAQPMPLQSASPAIPAEPVPAEALEPLPVAEPDAVDEGVARFNAIHDEQDAAEAGQTLTDDEEAAEAAADTTEPAPVTAQNAPGAAASTPETTAPEAEVQP